MSFTNFEQGDDWELGDAIRIPVDLDDDPETDEQAGDGDDDADDGENGGGDTAGTSG